MNIFWADSRLPIETCIAEMVTEFLRLVPHYKKIIAERKLERAQSAEAEGKRSIERQKQRFTAELLSQLTNETKQLKLIQRTLAYLARIEAEVRATANGDIDSVIARIAELKELLLQKDPILHRFRKLISNQSLEADWSAHCYRITGG